MSSVSLQLGCVRLTERFLTSDPPTPDQVAATRIAIADALTWGEQQMPELLGLDRRRRLVGLAGTVSTLASLQLQVAEYDVDRLHHATLGLTEVVDLCAKLAALSAAERSRLVGMVPGRADVILGGALVLEVVAARYQCPAVIVSEKDILDGIVLSIL